MRPALRPGVVVTWRSTDTTCIELGPHRVAISGLGVGGTSLLRLLDGTRTDREIDLELRRSGLAIDVDAVLRQLTRAGVLYDAAQLPRLDAHSPVVRERLLTEAITWQTGSDSAATFERRLSSTIRLVSTDALTVAIAAILVNCGAVGFTVDAVPDDARVVEHSEAVLGAYPAHAIGKPRHVAAREYLSEIGGVLRGRKASPDLALVNLADADTAADSLHDCAHLITGRSERTAIVGPLVLPGVTACHRCAWLTRADHDGPSQASAATETVGLRAPGNAVATAATLPLAASYAALAVLDYLTLTDQEPPRLPALAGHVLTLEVPGPALELAALHPHPRCGCCWALS